MTTLQQVAAEARGGATVGTIAARLGTSTGLVEAMLDELVRQSVLTPAALGAGCCTPTPSSTCAAEVRPPACAGCPLAGGVAVTEHPAMAPAGVRRLPFVGLRSAKRAAEAARPG